MPESRISRADRRSVAMRARVGEELRVARLAAGLSLADVCGATASSTSELSRIERGQAPWVDISTLARDSAVVGLDLWIRTYPGGEPLRDLGHVRLGTAFRSIVASPLAIAAEVGIGDPRDLRAWDLSLTDPAGEHCGVELETRFVDVQAQQRRIVRKLEDSGYGRVLVVVSDIRTNRAAVTAAAGLLSATFAIDDRDAIQALRSGRLPPRSALIFLRPAGLDRVPAPREVATDPTRTSSLSPAPRHDPTRRPASRE